MGMAAESIQSIEGKVLRELRKPKNRAKLSPFICDYIDTHAYHGIGVKSFQRTWTSSTEYTAIGLMDL